jgi:hypothetical protein
MSEYDNTNDIIVSKVVSDNPNAPVLRVNLEDINGKKWKAGLWVWEKKDGTPVTDKDGNKKYKGKLEPDNYEPGQQSGASQAPASTPPAQDFEADEIPF